MVPFYSTTARFVGQLGDLLQPWISYLQQFTIAPPSFLPVTVGISPFAYEAKEPGNLFIGGGNVSALTLTRGTDTISLAYAITAIVPVAINDIVTVTYTVLPTIKFIPSYGQNTNQ